MTIRCRCKSCGAKFSLDTGVAGETIRCVKCGKVVGTLPADYGKPAPAEAAPEESAAEPTPDGDS